MAGRAQPSFKLDVNRTKTQRWVDAKQASYEGDDWGGYDDYDDIAEEAEEPVPPQPAPAPPAKVTGLRQRGQASTNSVKDTQTSSRPSSKPGSPQIVQQPFQRRSSFEAGDDRRDISNPSTRASAQATSATETPQTLQQRSPVVSQEILASQAIPTSHEPPRQPSPRPRGPSQGHVSRPSNSTPAIQTDIPPVASNSQDKPSPGQNRYYAKERNTSATGTGSTPSSGVDGPQRRDFPSSGPAAGTSNIRSASSQEFNNKVLPKKPSQELKGLPKKPSQEFRGAPPPRDYYDSRGPPSRDPRDHDYRGPPPPREYRGPPPGRDPRDYRGPPHDYRGPPPRDYRGPPPSHHDPRGPPYRGPPPFDPRDPRGPPRDMRGGPPYDYRGSPHDYRGLPPMRGDPRGDPRGDSRGDPRGDPRGPPSDYRPRPPMPRHESDERRPRKDSHGGPRRPSVSTAQSPPSHLGSHGEMTRNSGPQGDVSNVEGPPDEPAERSVLLPEMQHASVDKTGDTDAPLVVRPADIYKRLSVEKEKERQSMDSNRPSMDSLEHAGRPSQGSRPSTDSNGDSDSQQKLKPRLDTVAERKSEYGLESIAGDKPIMAATLAEHINMEPPLIPQFDRFSGFGLELGWDSTPAGPSGLGKETKRKDDTPKVAPGTAQASNANATDLQQQPSFRTAVNDAFEGEVSGGGVKALDSQKITNTSDMSRSNTDSTAGISPIMSRVPSAGTTERRLSEQAEQIQRPPTSIEEEPSSDSRPASSATLKAALDATSIPAAHTRDVSGGSASAKSATSLRQFSSPEPIEVSAHTAAISSRKVVEHSNEGELGVTSPTSPSQPTVTTNMARRESDLADTARVRVGTSPEVGNEEKDAQTAFIDAHRPTPVITTGQLSSPDGNTTNGNSPSKGRVQELASKFNDIQDRASPTSSISSWSSSARPSPSTSRENLRATDVSEKPALPGPASLSPHNTTAARDLQPPRPAVPGQWVSYNNSEDSNAAREGRSSSEAQHSHDEQSHNRDKYPADPTPTTTKQQLPGHTFEQHAESAMAQLAASGNALAQNLQAAMARRTSPSPSREEAPSDNHAFSEAAPRGLMPPSQALKEAVSSASSVPPTPPAKDTPQDRDGAPQRQSGYFPSVNGPPSLRVSNPDPKLTVKSVDPPSAGSPMSMESTGDMESDRLRKDIFKSLASPPAEIAHTSGSGLGLAPMDADVSRVSSVSILPHEYDSYWAGSPRNPSSDKLTDSRRISAVSSEDRGISSAAAPKSAAERETNEIAAPTISQETKSPKSPNFLQSRFSWEEGEEAVLAPSSAPGSATRAMQEPSTVPRMSEDGSASVASSGPKDVKASLESPTELRISLAMAENPIELDSENSMLREVSPTPIEMATHADEDSDSGATRPRTDSKALPTPSSPNLVQSPSSKRDNIKAVQIPSFRQATNAKTSAERIATYQQMHVQIRNMDTGLSNWLDAMMQMHPEHSQGAFGGARPSTANTGTVRARQQGGPDLGQAGQDIIHVAGKIGGKASQGAKGLFAKGRNRFRKGSVDKSGE